MPCISGAAVRAAGTVASGAICSAGLDTRTSDSMTGRPERVRVALQPVEPAGLFSNLLKPSPVIALGRASERGADQSSAVYTPQYLS